MALKTNVTVVIVPRAMEFELVGLVAVNIRIGSPDAIGVAVTAGPRAGGIRLIMADGAVFRITPRFLTMPSQPAGSRMLKRHATHRAMAVIAEGSRVVTGLAIQPFRFGVKTMRKLVIQIMNFAG